MYICTIETVTVKHLEIMTTTFNIGKEKFEVKNSSIQDVKIAYTYKSDQTSDWVYNVDTETMDEIRMLWKNAINGNLSIYDIFCKILKIN